eukprot:3833495-Amphidinium_carterae.1
MLCFLTCRVLLRLDNQSRNEIRKSWSSCGSGRSISRPCRANHGDDTMRRVCSWHHAVEIGTDSASYIGSTRNQKLLSTTPTRKGPKRVYRNQH